MGTQVKEHGGLRLTFSAGTQYRFPERLRLVWIKGDKFPAVPVSFEFDDEFPEDMVHVLGGDFEIPFKSTRDSGMRKVCGTDVGGRKSVDRLK